MKTITRCAVGSALMSALLTGRAYPITPYTTLNEKFGVQSGILPVASQMPFLNYVTIGNGGHTLSVGANGIAIPVPVQHYTTDCALYNHIPFVLREPANDLSPEQMAAYRLRVPVVYNGTNYIAYFAKVLDYTGVGVQLNLQTVNADGTVTTQPWVPDSSNLNPTPPVLANTGVNVVNGVYVVAEEQIPFNLTANDATELQNVANIIYGSPDYAIISEIGLCSGVDKVVQSSGSGAPAVTYTEAIATQTLAIFNSFYSMQYANDGIQVTLSVGSTEPLLELDQAAT